MRLRLFTDCWGGKLHVYTVYYELQRYIETLNNRSPAPKGGFVKTCQACSFHYNKSKCSSSHRFIATPSFIRDYCRCRIILHWPLKYEENITSHSQYWRGEWVLMTFKLILCNSHSTFILITFNYTHSISKLSKWISRDYFVNSESGLYIRRLNNQQEF